MWNAKFHPGDLGRPARGGWALALVLGISPSDAPAEVLSGAVSGDRFGESVAWAGDVNGDGFQDYLVGASGGRGAAGITGTASLYLGVSAGFSEVPAVVLEGEVGGDAFGRAVSAAGDVNGDGFDDFLVGAPNHDAAGLDAGRTYLYLGGDPFSTTPERSWDGDLAGSHFGAALAGGFHFNGDAYADFAVGAPESNLGSTRAGRVEIYLGDADPGSILQPTNLGLNGDAANWGLGFSLDPAGDVNGDGFDDLAAGAPQLFDVNPGQAVIWLGQASALSIPARRIMAGELGGARFGFSVSGAGDRNQDGFADLAVGAPGFDSQGSDKGAMYVIFGGVVADPDYDWRTVGGTGGDSLGYAVDGDFDLDHDGLPDLAAGAPGADFPAADAGEVRVFLGLSHPAESVDQVLTPIAPQAGFEADDRVGAAVRFLPSANGDVYDDLLVGAPQGNITSGIIAGYVAVVRGGPGGTPVRLLELIALPRGPAGAEIQWTLIDPEELSGLRLRVDRGEGWTALHAGWLSIHAERYLDPTPVTSRVSYRLEGLDRSGEIVVLGTTAMEAPAGLAVILLARENPFRTHLNLTVRLPGGPARVRVLDLSGREVRRLWDAEGGNQAMELVWDGRDAAGQATPPGAYVVTVEGAGVREARKVIRLP